MENIGFAEDAGAQGDAPSRMRGQPCRRSGPVHLDVYDLSRPAIQPG
jgi:hypothetical protein